MAEQKVEPQKIEKERSNFTQLILENPNYFGQLEGSTFKAVKKMAANVQYEQLNCVGYNPDRNLLEATISIKLPYGYGGDLCQAGSAEYVRFFIDYGAGWVDAGFTGVKVHDIPNSEDCAKVGTKPLTYVATLPLNPKIAECCNHPVLPKVHAILSWNLIPPAGPVHVGWLPPWGNALDCHIQIKPHPWNLFCIFEELSEVNKKQLEIPKLFESVKEQPIPIPVSSAANFRGTGRDIHWEGGAIARDEG